MATKAAAKRAAKPPLDREAFVEAALRLASRHNTVSLTFRELGNEMGVDPTAIYRHFLNKESLMQELLDRVFLMAIERLETPTNQWQECLQEFAVRTLDVFMEHPAIAASATSLTTSGQGELDSIELMLTCFSRRDCRAGNWPSNMLFSDPTCSPARRGLPSTRSSPPIRTPPRGSPGRCSRTRAPPRWPIRSATKSWPWTTARSSSPGSARSSRRHARSRRPVCTPVLGRPGPADILGP